MGSNTNISDYRFSIFINNDQAKRSLVDMEKVMMGYEAELAKLVKEKKKDTQEYRDAKKVYDDHLEQMKKVRQEAGLQAMSLKELKALRIQLNNELARAIPGTEHRANLEKQFKAVNTRMNELQVGAKTTSLTFGKLADGFNRYFAVVTAGLAVISGFAFSIKNLITAQGELDDSLANIRKSTGMTAGEVKELNNQLGKIDTRTSRQDLRQMAVVAGQLGIAKEDVFGFVESVDKLNVSLGDEFTGGAEEVARQMGMLRNVLTDSKTANVADDMMRVGNAINALGAAGFATGPVMTDFASRIGGIGIPLGLTSDEVLGLSATLQELNVNAERGGTAVVKILQKMTTNTDAFAKIAGMPVKEFTELVNTDLYGAFLRVIEGSNKGGQSATALAGIIKELEISGVGASEIFAKLGNNTQMLAEKTKLAGDTLQSTDSITNEFNIKNATLGATMDKLSKEFYKLITLPGVTEFFKNQVYHVVQFVNWLKDLPLIIEKYRIVLIAAAGALGVWIAGATRSLQVSLLNNLTMKEGILLKLKDNVVMAYLIAKEELLTIWKGRGTVASKLAATAQLLWNAAVSANPIGLLIAGMTAMVAAIKMYDKFNAESVRNEKLKLGTIERMNVVNKTLGDNYQYLNDQISKLNRLSVQEKKDLDEKIDKNIKLAETELALMKARQDKVRKDNTTPSMWQRVSNAVLYGAMPGGAAVANAEDAANNGLEAAGELNDGIKQLEDNLKSLKNTKGQLNEIIRSEQVGDSILAKTYEALSERLGKYQTALRNTVAGSEDYARIQGKIKETNKELAKFNSDSGGTAATGEGKSNKLNDLKTEYEQLNEQINELMGLLRVEALTDPEYAKVIAARIQRVKNYQKSLEDATNALLAQAEAESKLDKMPMRSGVSSTQQGITALPEGYQHGAPTPDTTPTTQENISAWGQKANSFLNDYVAPVMNGIMQLDQLMSERENAQLARDERNNNEKKKNLQRQLDAKKISQREYDNQIAKMDAEMERKKRDLQIKQAKRQRTISLTQAIINTALGVTSALSMQPFIVGLIMAVVAAAMGAVQIATIAGTSVSEAARGRYGIIRKMAKVEQAAMGRYDVLGQDDKKMYRGVPYVQQPDSGLYTKPTLFAETGGEIILNPKHTQNLMRFRPDLVHAIMHEVPQRAGGLYPDPGAMAAAAGPQVVRFDSESLQAMRSFTEQLSRPIDARLSYDHMMTEMDKVWKIEADAAK